MRRRSVGCEIIPDPNTVKTSVADPDPGSGMGLFRMTDLGSQAPIFFLSLVTIFGVKVL
jgi:hypothetical protein